jgi:two-component system, OmpR family, phosphate regulon sensor histidine kinase PhoR
MMRLPIFFRILLIIFIPFFQLLIVTGTIHLSAIELFSRNNTFLFIFTGFFISVVFAYLTSKKFTDALLKIEFLLRSHENFQISTRNFQNMPPEIENLYLQIKESTLNYTQTQDSLIAERKMFNSILDNMTDGILISDKNGMVSMINHSASQLFHANREDAITHSLAEVTRDYRINELFEKCSKSQHQETESFETAPDKTFIQCIATPLDPELPGTILFLIQDLTRIRQLEIIRRDFVSNVSHELRTPLTSLKIITETLQEGALDDPSIAKDFIMKMGSEVDNLTHLVEELLELSKIESGRVPLEKRYVKPYDLIKGASERMLLQAQRAGLDLTNSSNPDIQAIFIDQSRLEQVLLNLIHNAIKFTPPGGKVEVSAYQESGSIIFFVKDNGKGIPPKDLERIFERFYKTDRSRSEQGTGLGLSISRHLVEAHKGKIWVESQVGLGSTFFFSIPLK